jgi:heme-degrading monooxygenase HmoA
MFVIRETFTAKPGKASALATMFKQVMGEMTTLKTRVMTDYIAGFNTVVLETEVQNLGDFEKELETYMSRQDLRDKMKGYTEMYQDGRREVYKVV